MHIFNITYNASKETDQTASHQWRIQEEVIWGGGGGGYPLILDDQRIWLESPLLSWFGNPLLRMTGFAPAGFDPILANETDYK